MSGGYEVAAHHGQVVKVVVIPLKTPEAYEATNQQMNPPSPGAKTEDGLTINLPTAGQPRYKSEFRRGRYGVELFGGDCEGAVRYGRQADRPRRGATRRLALRGGADCAL